MATFNTKKFVYLVVESDQVANQLITLSVYDTKLQYRYICTLKEINLLLKHHTCTIGYDSTYLKTLESFFDFNEGRYLGELFTADESGIVFFGKVEFQRSIKMF